jgi:hypothetical protein
MFDDFEKVFTSFQHKIEDTIYSDIARAWQSHKEEVNKFTDKSSETCSCGRGKAKIHLCKHCYYEGLR